MRRNRRPRGHKEKRGPNTYRLWVPLGPTDDGYEWYRETFHGTEEEADKRLTALLNQKDTNRLAKSGTMTFGEYLDQWLLTYVDVHTKPGTADSYRRHVELRIKPKLGRVRLAELSPLHIKHFFNGLHEDGARKDGQEGGLSASTIRKIRVVIRQALAHAVNDGLIPTNPAQSIKSPTVKRPDKRRWTWDELQRFLAVAKGHPYGALIHTLAYTGMRISEALALRWENVDFSGRYIAVEDNLYRAGPNPQFGTPKDNEPRRIPMDPELYAILRQHKAEQNSIKLAMGGDWNPHNLVFPNTRGNPIHRQNFYRRVWRPLIEEANRLAAENGEPPIPYINVHGLRHTFATLLLQWAADDKAVSEMLGHHSVEYTKDEYYDPPMEVHQAAISRFSQARKSGVN